MRPRATYMKDEKPMCGKRFSCESLQTSRPSRNSLSRLDCPHFLHNRSLGLPMGRLALYRLDFVYPLSIPVGALAFSVGTRCRKTLGPRMPFVSATFTCQGRKFHIPNIWF